MDTAPEEYTSREEINEIAYNGKDEPTAADISGAAPFPRISFGRASLQAMADEGGFIDPLAAIR